MFKGLKMNVVVVHIDINVSQHDYGVLTPNIASGNKLSVDCKELRSALHSVSVSSNICC